jgi:hypothetical protein
VNRRYRQGIDLHVGPRCRSRAIIGVRHFHMSDRVKEIRMDPGCWIYVIRKGDQRVAYDLRGGHLGP